MISIITYYHLATPRLTFIAIVVVLEVEESEVVEVFAF